jgi:hypothetical protein
VWSVDRIEVVDGTEFYVVRSGRTREIYRRKSDLAYFMDKVEGVVEERQVLSTSTVIPWPLGLRKSWEYRATRERPKDRSTTEELYFICRTGDAEELVSVPAGQFGTVRILCNDGRTGSFRSETWYAPGVKHWVRERSQFSYGVRERELIAYKVQ